MITDAGIRPFLKIKAEMITCHVVVTENAFPARGNMHPAGILLNKLEGISDV